MSRFVVFVLAALTCSAALAASQNARILSDARYLSNDGQFGAAYTQGDGVEFKEEADSEGNRRGSYSYVDPSGKRRTVTYTAGKDGFKATGDHLPVAPTPVPVPAAVPSAKSQWSQPPSVPNQWNQQWASAAAPTPSSRSDDGQWSADNEESKYDDGQWAKWSQSSDEGQWNQWNSVPVAVPSPKQLQWSQWNSIPAATKWSGVAVDGGSQWNGVAPTAPPPSYSVNQASGKFNLNRSPDGFSYTYSQN